MANAKLRRMSPFINGTSYCGMLLEDPENPQHFGPDLADGCGPYYESRDTDAEIERLEWACNDWLLKHSQLVKAVNDAGYMLQYPGGGAPSVAIVPYPSTVEPINDPFEVFNALEAGMRKLLEGRGGWHELRLCASLTDRGLLFHRAYFAASNAVVRSRYLAPSECKHVNGSFAISGRCKDCGVCLKAIPEACQHDTVKPDHTLVVGLSGRACCVRCAGQLNSETGDWYAMGPSVTAIGPINSYGDDLPEPASA